MATPDDSGDHSVRSLAEILREHGLESEFGTRPNRRRKEDEPKADWPARPAPEDQPPSRLRPKADWPARPAPEDQPPSKLRPPPEPAREQPRREPPQAVAPLAAILREHGLESEFGTRPDRRDRHDDAADRSARTTPPRNSPARTLGPRTTPPRAAQAQPASAATSPPRSGAAPGTAVPAPRSTPAATPDVPMYGRRSTDAPLPPSLQPGAMPSSSGPSTAAIPAVRASDRGAHATGPIPGPVHAADAAPAGGPLAWGRFAAELVVAVAAGIGIYFAFTVLWELVPYVALIAAPATVTLLVAGVSLWRHRQGQAQLGVRLLAALLFAGTLLTIAPAAALLAGT